MVASQPPWLGGDLFAQRSSYNGEVTGGINLESVVALGREGELALGSREMGGIGNEAAMILDIDADDEGARIRVSDDLGGVQTLGPGRHLVSVPALQSGALQLEMDDHDGEPLTIRPTVLPYHLNRGGVGYGQVNALRTVTVIGRLLDKQGAPLKGAMVVNHAGRTVSEADGFFALEMSERNPNFQVQYQGGTAVRAVARYIQSGPTARGITTREGANKRGNSSRLTQSFHFFMFEPIFSPVNASNQPI
ncbi:CS1-pili formation C-terminal domain-containing protein [Aeromonas veronii]|uniref:CS1-pili formation C-terminal domain-containing protein n=1 Tax=Aeromonas veronii TaxID=654 RepID=UPI0024441A6B|nr:CS1-pili formation C-terminal domain-containing protein [Aeromonas veronii]